MLKTLFSFVLIFVFWKVEAQQINNDSNFVRPIYIDASIGLRALAMADINLGVNINKKTPLAFLILVVLSTMMSMALFHFQV